MRLASRPTERGGEREGRSRTGRIGGMEHIPGQAEPFGITSWLELRGENMGENKELGWEKERWREEGSDGRKKRARMGSASRDFCLGRPDLILPNQQHTSA